MWPNAHDSMNVGHDRNFKKLGWLLKGLTPEVDFCIRVFDVEYYENTPRATVFQYSDNFIEVPVDKSINLVVWDGHLRFLQPSRETFPGSWKAWKSMVWTVKEVPWLSWEEALESDPLAEMDGKPIPCRVCGVKCKLAGDSTAGTGYPLDQLTGEGCIVRTEAALPAQSLIEEWGRPNPWIHSIEDVGDPSIEEKGDGVVNQVPWRNQNRSNGKYPVTQYEWRKSGPIMPESERFHQVVRQEFSKKAVKEAVEAGDALVKAAGSLDEALYHFQEPEFRKLAPQCEFIRDNKMWIEEYAEEMMEEMRIGATASYMRPPPVTPRRRGLPYKEDDSLELMQGLWKDITKGRMFMCSFETIGGFSSDIEMTPTTLVPKRNPDRSLSTEKRIIADLRRINLYFDQSEDYPAVLPTVDALAKKIVCLKRKFPTQPVLLTKRDIKSAFRLIRLHPLMAKVMGTEMRGHHFECVDDVVIFYGVLPFGWGSSPSKFVRFSDAITKLHQLSGPSDPTWNLPYAFRSSMFIDDGLFIEVMIGDRRRRSVEHWESVAKGLLSIDAINKEKEKEEGEWLEEQIFLGFSINTANMTITLPEEKRAGATILFDELFSEFGSRVIRLISLQRLRGNIEHFRSTNMIWSFFTGPIDSLMCYADETGVWINCGSKHAWYAFWNAMDVIRIIRMNDESWRSLFTGTLERLLPPEQRFACEQHPDDIVWISADATLERVAGICWEDKEFFTLDAESLVRPFKREESEKVIIGECELVVILIAVLSWCRRDGKTRILIVCTDNLNVFAWLSNWKAKSSTANTILKALIDHLVESGVEIIPRYVRSDHNMAADFLSRCTGEEALEWEKQNDMQRVELPQGWFELTERWRPEVDFYMLTRFQIPDVIENYGSKLTACEWRPAVYGLASILDKCGSRSYVFEPPHSVVLRAMKSATEWAKETITLFGGMVWSEYEMIDFIYALEEIQPLVAVAITPYAFKEPETVSLAWGAMIVVDSSMYGSILNQRWKMYVWGCLDIAYLHFDVLHRQKRVLEDGYCEAGLNAKPDVEGLMRTVPFDALCGLTITVRGMDENPDIRYSLQSHIPQLTLNEIWTETVRWPKKRDDTEVDVVDKIMILGGHKDWGRLRKSNSAALVGSLYKIGPVDLWKRVVYAVLTSSMGEGEIPEEIGEEEDPPTLTNRGEKEGKNFYPTQSIEQEAHGV